MERVVPWAQLEAALAPLCQASGDALAGLPTARLLRMHLLQRWFSLPDEVLAETVCDSRAMRAFCRIGPEDHVPDERAMRAFHDQLEQHDVGRSTLLALEEQLRESGVVVAGGSIAEPQVVQAQVPGKAAEAVSASLVDHALEQALYERDSQLHAFIDGAPAAIAMFDRQMRFLVVSCQYARDRNLTQADLIGRTVYEVFPQTPERWRTAHLRCLQGSTERCESDVFVRADGSSDLVRWEIRPWHQADGTVGGLILFSEVITERKEAERRITESEARLELATRAVALGIYDYNIAENITTWDARIRAIWGVGPDEEATFNTFLGGLHPEDRERTLFLLEESLGPNSDGHHRAEYRVINRQDGSVRWVSSNGSVFFEDGRAVRMVGTIQDVTERKRTALALEESERRFRTVVEQAADAFFLHDDAGRFIDVNQQACASLGYTREELLRLKVTDLQQDFDLPSSQRGWRQIEPGHAHTVYAQHRRKDGSAFPVETRLSACDIAGQRLYSLLVRDISERELAARALRDSEERFRHLTEAIPQLVWTCDDHARFDYVSAQWTQYTGQTLAQARCHGWLKVAHEQDRGVLRERWLAAVSRGVTFDAETRIRGADGQYRWFKQRAVPVRRADGTLERWFGTSTDITDLVAARESLSTLAEELRQADHRKDAFLATLSHELRNPLAPIRTAAQILVSPKLTDAQLNWARQVIQRQVTHMALLLDDLLEIARITRGKLVLKKERVSLNSIVDSAVEAARPLIEGKHHHLFVSLPARAPLLDADPLRMSQVLSNLLTNAAKYTDPGGQIQLTARLDGQMLVLSVKDNGIGIPPEALGRVFKMFWQLEGAAGRSEGGLGIGLAFVKGLVELHGGAIEALSDGPGHGSEFVVRLPVPTALPDADSSPRSDARPIPIVARRVLVADDNKDAADSLAMLLRLAGHEVRVAHSGRSALSLAQAFRPDTAVLDIGMPDIDGYGVASALRKEPGGEAMCLIALTGWGQEEDKERACQVGFDHHLTKPVKPETLEVLLSGNTWAARTPAVLPQAQERLEA
jgi:PAS domain S-box-containing protein